jgi:ADP-heptose:LPS heptosyltransferase
VRDPQRILIIRLSHLGDVVHALGVFHALHAAYPGARIRWAIQPEFADLVAGLDGLEGTVLFDRRGGPLEWMRLRRSLAAQRPDLAVDAQGNAKSAAVTWLSRAPRRVAPARRDWQEPWAAWTGGERAPALVPPARHAMQRMEQLVRALVPDAPLPLRTDVGLSTAERSAGEELLRTRFPRLGDGGVLVHLSTPGDVRSWSGAHWRELLARLEAAGRPTLVLSGPAEAALGAELARALPAGERRAHWVGQRGLRELASFMDAAARRGASLVACDSGPMHLGAACGLRVVALAGPQDELRTGPWPLVGVGPHSVVRAPDGPACAPCLARRCTHAAGPVCMERIRPEAVVRAVTSQSI